MTRPFLLDCIWNFPFLYDRIMAKMDERWKAVLPLSESVNSYTSPRWFA